MNNKTKKEIYEELQQYKKKVQQYEDFWEVEVIDEYQKNAKKIIKILQILSVFLLMGASFLIGLIIS